MADALKPWWQSKTIIGAFIMVISLLANQLTPVDITAGEQLTLTEGIVNVGSLIGLIMVIVGRATATKKIV